MVSVIRENAAARNRRGLHERRIQAAATPMARLAQSWAWLYVEARRRPAEDIERIARRVERTARWLNERRTR